VQAPLPSGGVLTLAQSDGDPASPDSDGQVTTRGRGRAKVAIRPCIIYIGNHL
jgi:hypothetical protein